MSGGKELPQTPKPGHPFSEEEIQLLKLPFTSEELEQRKVCLFNSYIKIGLPMAFLSQAFLTFKKSAQPVTLARRGLNFAGYMLATTVLFKPGCDYYIRAHRLESHRRKKAEGQESVFPATEEVQSFSHQEDLSFSSEVRSNFEQRETFSADFSSIALDLEDRKEGQEARNTTYKDLREKNRRNYSQPAPSSYSQILHCLESHLVFLTEDLIVFFHSQPHLKLPKSIYIFYYQKGKSGVQAMQKLCDVYQDVLTKGHQFAEFDETDYSKQKNELLKLTQSVDRYEKTPNSPVGKLEEDAPRPRKLNKYGDEME